MAGCNTVEVFSEFIFKAPELDEKVAHHIRVWRKTMTYRGYGVIYDPVPVFLVQVDDFKTAAIFLRDKCRDFDIFLRRAVHESRLILRPYLDIENDRIIPLVFQQRHDYGAVDSSGD